MSNIKLLDCTLRDGGYINNWSFGSDGIKSIISNLTNAGIEYIECGFFKTDSYDINKSIFSDLNQLKLLLPQNQSKTFYTLMINYGEYDIKLIPKSDNKNIIFRIVFNKEDIRNALDYCKNLQEKGYRIFINPKNTCSYTREELASLIAKVNDINPEAMTIVDTTGSMTNKDVLEFYEFTDNLLNQNIKLCFHFHNNMQLSFSNAQFLISAYNNREIIIDSTVMGIGRGAGNLSTEIISQYLNTHCSQNYDIAPILNIADTQINPIYEKTPWGYSMPYYLSAINHCHPNYAKYMIEKQNISVELMNELFNKIPYEKRSHYDKKLIEQLCNIQ